ncbi:MAG: SpoIID/LytB domain-containing protein [Clostridia bacterium]|nr:SpoIID/LytB domain-containing protein [Clostridia bacterium]
MRIRLMVILGVLIGLLLLSTLPSEAATSIRVGLVVNTTSAQSFTVSENYLLLDGSTGKTLAALSPGQNWQAAYAGGAVSISRDGAVVAASSNPLICRPAQAGSSIAPNILTAAGGSRSGVEGMIVTPVTMSGISINTNSSFQTVQAEPKTKINTNKTENANKTEDGIGTGIFTLNSAQYRGSLEFRSTESGLVVINELDIEDYLKSVVPREMSGSWPLEALKAQAVAARSYALYHQQQGRFSNLGFDLKYDQQVYQGISTEHPTSTEAVNQTAGQMLLCNGNAVEAVFHTSNGGYTEASGDVWGADLPYLHAAVDPYDANESNYNWSKTCSKQDLTALASKYGLTEITDLSVTSYTRSGSRIKELLLVGKNSAGEISSSTIKGADQVRGTLGLKSTVCELQKECDADGSLNQVILTGNGYGHGLGLSQYGAYGRAKAGHTYQQILDFYYPNCQLVSDK